jgi:protocatechuate 3,4-dioxygenase beta subunit
MAVRGRVLSPDGMPIPHARLDVWQSDAEEHYDLQMPDLEGTALRAIFHTDAEGQFTFRTIKPSLYPVPYDGPVGRMLIATGRLPHRPATSTSPSRLTVTGL